MPSGPSTELVQPLRSSPLWTLLRRGLSARVDTALVFEARSGEFRVRMPGPAAEREKVHGRWFRISGIVLRRFRHPHQVHVSEQLDSFIIPLASSTIPWNAEVTVPWHVSDPIQLVKRSLHHVDEVRPYVQRAVHERLHTRIGDHLHQPAEEASRELRNELRESYPIAELGVTYRVGNVELSIAESPREAESDSSPRHWEPARREEFEFYKGVVRGGREALLSLWLMRESTNVQTVLEWIRDNPEPEEPSRELDAELANLFHNLDGTERGLLRRHALHTLERLGTPGSGALLERLLAQDGAAGSTNGGAPATEAGTADEGGSAGRDE